MHNKYTEENKKIQKYKTEKKNATTHSEGLSKGTASTLVGHYLTDQ